MDKEIHIESTHKTPFRKRNVVNTTKLFASDEKTVRTNATNKAGCKTRLRPFVSAMKPQKCDVMIIPKNGAAPKMPFSCVVKFKSHCDTGMIKLMPHVSRFTASNTKPARVISK